MFFRRLNNIHMVGIGGTGMSGIAEILLKRGFSVSGCDCHDQEILDHLKTQGAMVQTGHHPDHIRDSDVVVYSSAVDPDHPELQTARDLKIPVIKRAEMLGELTRLGYAIAVSGTHGKTTTTSIIGYLADQLGLDPTIIVGGRLISYPGHARVGTGPCILEADEFDRSLQNIHATCSVMTIIDRDHLDCYLDFADICQTFLNYLQEVPFFGKVILNIDDEIQQSFMHKINRPIFTYGTSDEADFKISDPEFSEQSTRFTCHVPSLNCSLRVSLPIFGLHNAYNATAALASIWDYTEDETRLREAAEHLSTFPGVSRRFELIGHRSDTPVISDYAHHPKEVEAVLASARQAFPNRNLAVIFQPHLYSRTRLFSREFAENFMSADLVTVLPVYPAREKPIEGVTGESIIENMRMEGHRKAFFARDLDQAVTYAEKHGGNPLVLIVIGAGSIHYDMLDYIKETGS